MKESAAQLRKERRLRKLVAVPLPFHPNLLEIQTLRMGCLARGKAAQSNPVKPSQTQSNPVKPSQTQSNQNGANGGVHQGFHYNIRARFVDLVDVRSLVVVQF